MFFAPMRFDRNEMGYISWVGLCGAVPIVLAIFPFMAKIPEAQLILDLDAPDNAYITLEAWIAEALKRPLVVGDHAMLGTAELSVRSMHFYACNLWV